MNGIELQYPAPQVTALSQPFWEGCRQRRLRLQKCQSCGALRFYPSEACADCRSTAYDWVDVSGRGRIFSWIVVHRSVDPVWQRRAPFVTGIIEIAEQPGCRIPGIILGVKPADVRDGMAVQVEFEETAPDIVVPRWRVL